MILIQLCLVFFSPFIDFLSVIGSCWKPYTIWGCFIFCSTLQAQDGVETMKFLLPRQKILSVIINRLQLEMIIARMFTYVSAFNYLIKTEQASIVLLMSRSSDLARSKIKQWLVEKKRIIFKNGERKLRSFRAVEILTWYFLPHKQSKKEEEPLLC